MPVIRNVYTDAAGVPLKNVWVMITLISRAGWSKTGQSRAVRVHSDMTDATGLWTSPDLPPQSSYAETNTYYRVECEGKIDYFDVPDSGGPYWLADRRRSPIPIDADWKVLPKLVELPDATAMAAATDGQVPVYNATTKTFQPITRVTAQQLADGLASKAAKQYVDDADQALSNRISPIETWKPGVDTALAGKASTTSVTGVSDRVTTNTSDITSLKQRMSTVEGGGSGSSGAVQHGSLRYLVTGADGSTVDDHPQYLNQSRGDARYYPKTTADATFAGLTHAARHKTGQADALAPGDIGASPATHIITDHRQAGQVQPIIYVATASATDSNLAHAGMATDVPSDNQPRLRSLRQPVSHPLDQSISVELGNSANNNTVVYQDFTMRESGDILFLINIYHYLNTTGSVPAGTGGACGFTVTIFDMTDGSKVWEDVNGYYAASFAMTNNIKPTTVATLTRPVSIAGGFQRGRRYRLQVYATKTEANAPVRGWYARGSITEVAFVSG